MDNVIELSSSPEPHSPPANAKKSLAKRPAKRPFYATVIELSDSEPSPPKRVKRAISKPPVAGPSRPRRTTSRSQARATPGPSQTSSGSRPGPSKTALVVVPSSPARSPSAQADSPYIPPTPALPTERGFSPIQPLFLPDDDELFRFDTPRFDSPAARTPPPQASGLDVAAEATPSTPPPQTADLPEEDVFMIPPEEEEEEERPSDAADPIDAATVRVLEIIPDVQLDHLIALLVQHMPAAQDQVVDVVVSALLEDPKYPRTEKKGKRRWMMEQSSDERGASRVKIDYADKKRKFRGGAVYDRLAEDQLCVDFPQTHLRHIRRIYKNHNRLYAPSWIYLEAQRKNGKLPVGNSPSRRKGKAKATELENADFEAERRWILEYQERKPEVVDVDPPVEEEQADDVDESGQGIECGCCFASYSFEKMIQCPDAHLFCASCITSYASGLLGSHNPNIICMDQSGCKLPFPVSELRRMLTEKLMKLYDRVKQNKDIEAAELENLEECPYCEYKVVIDNENEKLFRCENEECGAVTCRGCKKLDHLPRSCKEVEDDKHLDGRHQVEEAMTRALMRNCPKCQKAFVKDMGCNKMMCPHCRTMSCYSCRQEIQGYDHFDQTGADVPSTSKKCKLWEPVEQRHHEEVVAAAKQAVEEYKQQHPELDEDSIKVDLPAAPPPAPAPGVPAPLPMVAAYNLMPGRAMPAPIPAAYGVQMPLPPLPRLNLPVYNPPLPAPLPVVVPRRRPRRARRH